MSGSKTPTKAQLIETLDRERKEWAFEKRKLNVTIGVERQKRVDAQNGLTPYVYALQAFAQWLGKHPKATPAQVIAQMSKLGIWGVKVAYDPQKDLALSIISAQRA